MVWICCSGVRFVVIFVNWFVFVIVGGVYYVGLCGGGGCYFVFVV